MRTTQFAASIIAAVMALTVAGIADADENPELKRVAIALRPVLEKFDIRADISYPSGTTSLVVSYGSQLYKIHGGAMTGEISPDAHDETGPSFKGFVLRVRLQDKGKVNQAATPQTHQEPYWKTYLDVTPIGGTQKQIYWALSFGSRTDTKLLAQLKKALNDLKDAEAVPSDSLAQPSQPDARITSGADAELFLAVFRGNSNQVARALHNGANINARHHGLMAAARLAKATPLYAAVFDNKPEIVASLLALGADPTIPNEAGETPLELAQKRKFGEIVQILTKESSNKAPEATR